MEQKQISYCNHYLNAQYLTSLYRGIFYRERSGKSYPDPGAAVEESNHCGSGQEGCSWSLCYQVLFSLNFVQVFLQV